MQSRCQDEERSCLSAGCNVNTEHGCHGEGVASTTCKTTQLDLCGDVQVKDCTNSSMTMDQRKESTARRLETARFVPGAEAKARDLSACMRQADGAGLLQNSTQSLQPKERRNEVGNARAFILYSCEAADAGGSGLYIVYILAVCTGGRVHTVRRRYSEFRALWTELLRTAGRGKLADEQNVSHISRTAAESVAVLKTSQAVAQERAEKAKQDGPRALNAEGEAALGATVSGRESEESGGERARLAPEPEVEGQAHRDAERLGQSEAWQGRSEAPGLDDSNNNACGAAPASQIAQVAEAESPVQSKAAAIDVGVRNAAAEDADEFSLHQSRPAPSLPPHQMMPPPQTRTQTPQLPQPAPRPVPSRDVLLSLLPPFPPPVWFNSRRESVVRQRRVALQLFCDAVLGLPALLALPCVVRFFALPQHAPTSLTSAPVVSAPASAQLERERVRNGALDAAPLPSPAAHASPRRATATHALPLNSGDAAPVMDAAELQPALRALDSEVQELHRLATAARDVLRDASTAESQVELRDEIEQLHAMTDELRAQRRLLKREVRSLREAAAVREAEHTDERERLRQEAAQAHQLAARREESLAAREESDQRLMSRCLSLRSMLGGAVEADDLGLGWARRRGGGNGTDDAPAALLLRQVRQVQEQASRLSNEGARNGLGAAIASQLAELILENAQLRERFLERSNFCGSSSLSDAGTNAAVDLSFAESRGASIEQRARARSASPVAPATARWSSVYGIDANGHAPGLRYMPVGISANQNAATPKKPQPNNAN
uniref:PX domain-containing protein n=1 Tax=Chrysotila carterae TaxID=13221 RepID=A0A7S4F2F7_CHRCT